MFTKVMDVINMNIFRKKKKNHKVGNIVVEADPPPEVKEEKPVFHDDYSSYTDTGGSVIKLEKAIESFLECESTKTGAIFVKPLDTRGEYRYNRLENRRRGKFIFDYNYTCEPFRRTVQFTKAISNGDLKHGSEVNQAVLAQLVHASKSIPGGKYSGLSIFNECLKKLYKEELESIPNRYDMFYAFKVKLLDSAKFEREIPYYSNVFFKENDEDTISSVGGFDNLVNALYETCKFTILRLGVSVDPTLFIRNTILEYDLISINKRTDGNLFTISRAVSEKLLNDTDMQVEETYYVYNVE